VTRAHQRQGLAGSAGIVGATLLALLSSSCIRQTVTFAPRDLFRSIPELRNDGRARVEVSPNGSHELTRDQVLEVGFESCRAFGLFCSDEKRILTVDQLIANCPVVPPFREDRFRRQPPCLLLETSSEAIPVDTRLRPNWEIWKVVGGATAAMLVIGVAFGYIADCKQPDHGC